MTRYGRPSSVPASNTVTMCALSMALIARASRANRATTLLVGRELGVDELDRDALAEAEVLGLVDGAHAAVTERDRGARSDPAIVLPTSASRASRARSVCCRARRGRSRRAGSRSLSADASTLEAYAATARTRADGRLYLAATPSLWTCAERREIVREAAFGWRTPLVAALSSATVATLSAVAAAALSFAWSAVRTRFTSVRTALETRGCEGALDTLTVALLGGRVVGHGQNPRQNARKEGLGARTLCASRWKVKASASQVAALPDQRAGLPTQAPAQARPHAIGENARAKTSATGAASPRSTSMSEDRQPRGERRLERASGGSRPSR